MLGGARSGKSAHAEGLLGAGRAVYVATAGRRDGAGRDPDWEARIDAHRARRPAGWRTVEDADLPALLADADPAGPPLLVDDLGTWLARLLDDTGGWSGGLAAARARCDVLVAAVTACRARLVLVSAEVGLGVVPATGSGRLFRDELGVLNARLAQACDEVLLLVAGLALRLR